MTSFPRLPAKRGRRTSEAALVSAVIVPHWADPHVRRLRGLVDKLLEQQMKEGGTAPAFATAIASEGSFNLTAEKEVALSGLLAPPDDR